MAPEKGYQRTYHFLFPASQLLLRTKKRPAERIGGSFAERGGFEPPIRFWRIHAFQACLLSHSSISPVDYLAGGLGNRVQRYRFFLI